MKFTPIGIIGIDENGKYHCISISEEDLPIRKPEVVIPGDPGRIVRSPTPEQVKIAKEEAVDTSLPGVLSKNTRAE